jgi:hypothetical protein
MQAVIAHAEDSYAVIGVSEMLREDAEALNQALEPFDRVLGAGRQPNFGKKHGFVLKTA